MAVAHGYDIYRFHTCHESSVNSSLSELLYFYFRLPTPSYINKDSYIFTLGLYRIDIGPFLTHTFTNIVTSFPLLSISFFIY